MKKHRGNIVACLITLLFLAIPHAVHACSCSMEFPEHIRLRLSLTYSDYVFVGRAKEMQPGKENPQFNYITFEILAAHKGDSASEFTVSTSRSDISCGTTFTMGERYLVFAGNDGVNGPIGTSICAGNILNPSKKQLAILDKGGISAEDAIALQQEIIKDPHTYIKPISFGILTLLGLYLLVRTPNSKTS